MTALCPVAGLKPVDSNMPKGFRLAIQSGGSAMNKEAKNLLDCSGFTFIEIIIVSVIAAILAAMAIPVYTGYISTQRQKAALTLAQTAAVTASSLYRKNGTVTAEQIKAKLFTYNTTEFTISLNSTEDSVVVNTSESIRVAARFR